MSNSGRLFVLSAPSGTGKSTVLRELRERCPELAFSISYTTRPRRGSERDGVEYHFVDVTPFRSMIVQGEFIEWAEVHGHFYGTARKNLEDLLQAGRDVLLDIDVQGGSAIKQAFPDATTIFLLPPSLEVLKERLAGRGTESPEELRIRLANARRELAFQDRYDHRVVNDRLEEACGAIEHIITHSSRPSRD
jgi:guanylate kinase